MIDEPRVSAVNNPAAGNKAVTSTSAERGKSEEKWPQSGGQLRRTQQKNKGQRQSEKSQSHYNRVTETVNRERSGYQKDWEYQDKDIQLLNGHTLQKVGLI